MGQVVSLGLQVAWPLQETGDTIAEGNRAGSWKGGCKRKLQDLRGCRSFP